jgi:hypothetical protein
LTVLLFLAQTVLAVFQKSLDPFGAWSWITAAQTAAWRLKWVSIPLLIVTVWLGRKLYRSIKLNPEKFCGLKHARRGVFATSFVLFLIAVLIGVTVPERLRQRQMAKDATVKAHYYRFEAATFEYQVRYQTYPADIADLRKRIHRSKRLPAQWRGCGKRCSEIAILARRRYPQSVALFCHRRRANGSTVVHYVRITASR